MNDRDLEATYDLVHQAALSGIDQDGEDWKEHPLFMTELPDDIENHKHLGAIQHVMYDGETPDSLAKHFKNLGNDLFKSGKHNWLAAAKWWTQGLKENPTDKSLRSILHSNRATVSLGLGQLQKAALDADWAIKYDKYNKKAYLRAAHAYQGMANWDKALSAAEAGIEICPENDPMRNELQEVIKKVKNELSVIDKRIGSYYDSIKSTSSYLKKRNFSVGMFENSWQGNWDLYLQYDEDKEETIWPLAIIFDEVLQVDFIEGVSESTKLIEIIAMILPGILSQAQSPSWDLEKRYQTSNVLLYYYTNAVPWVWGRNTSKKSSKINLINPEISLRQLFEQNDYIIPGFPKIYLGIKNTKFIENLKITQILDINNKKRDLTIKEIEDLFNSNLILDKKIKEVLPIQKH